VSLIASTAGSLMSLLAAQASLISPRTALEIRMGILIAAASALPAFVLWPPPGDAVRKRFRELDEGTVFEALLEAPEGPARDMLSRLAEEKTSGLAQRPRRPVREALRAMREIRPLIALALACLVIAEAGSLIAFRRPLSLLRGGEGVGAAGARIQEDEFSPFAGEEAEARRLAEQERRSGEAGNPSAEEPGRSGTGQQSEGIAAPRRSRSGAAGKDPGTGRSELARSGEGGAAAGQASQAEGTPEQAARAQTGEGKAEARQASSPSRTGQGYEKTGDTRVPSPLLDYRSRFSAVFAERTGKRISAADELGLGALRDYERRYFGSFSIRAELGPSEDAYAALLKRRWRELKGSLK
jgi:hypothetical protein